MDLIGTYLLSPTTISGVDLQLEHYIFDVFQFQAQLFRIQLMIKFCAKNLLAYQIVWHVQKYLGRVPIIRID